jgi:hypothetical protein
LRKISLKEVTKETLGGGREYIRVDSIRERRLARWGVENGGMQSVKEEREVQLEK